MVRLGLAEPAATCICQGPFVQATSQSPQTLLLPVRGPCHICALVCLQLLRPAGSSPEPAVLDGAEIDLARPSYLQGNQNCWVAEQVESILGFELFPCAGGAVYASGPEDMHGQSQSCGCTPGEHMLLPPSPT